MKKINLVVNSILKELESAESKYKKLNSGHEGFAVIQEEVDELWDLVKEGKSSFGNNDMANECIQIAAMAIRFIKDLC